MTANYVHDLRHRPRNTLGRGRQGRRRGHGPIDFGKVPDGTTFHEGCKQACL